MRRFITLPPTPPPPSKKRKTKTRNLTFVCNSINHNNKNISVCVVELRAGTNQNLSHIYQEVYNKAGFDVLYTLFFF